MREGRNPKTQNPKLSWATGFRTEEREGGWRLPGWAAVGKAGTGEV